MLMQEEECCLYRAERREMMRGMGRGSDDAGLLDNSLHKSVDPTF